MSRWVLGAVALVGLPISDSFSCVGGLLIWFGWVLDLAFAAGCGCRFCGAHIHGLSF